MDGASPPQQSSQNVKSSTNGTGWNHNGLVLTPLTNIVGRIQLFTDERTIEIGLIGGTIDVVVITNLKYYVSLCLPHFTLVCKMTIDLQ